MRRYGQLKLAEVSYLTTNPSSGKHSYTNPHAHPHGETMMFVWSTKGWQRCATPLNENRKAVVCPSRSKERGDEGERDEEEGDEERRAGDEEWGGPNERGAMMMCVPKRCMKGGKHCQCKLEDLECAKKKLT